MYFAANFQGLSIRRLVGYELLLGPLPARETYLLGEKCDYIQMVMAAVSPATCKLLLEKIDFTVF